MDAKSELEELRKLEQLEARQAKSQGSPASLSMGMSDPVYGAGQLGSRALSYITSGGGNFPNSVSKAYDRSAQNMDNVIKDREVEYTARREQAGEKGFDGGRLLGNIANPINFAGGAAMAPTLARSLAYGLSQPVTDTDNYNQQKTMQAGLSTAGGAFGKVLGDKVLAPAAQKASDAAKLLKEKIPLTVGQTYGGIPRAIENKMTSVPILGDVIKGAQGRSIEGLNKATYRRALAPIGKDLPNDVNVGRDGVSYVNSQLSNAYDDLLPKLTGQADDQFIKDLDNVSSMVQVDDIMDPLDKNKFAQILKNTVQSRVAQNKGMTGEAIKQIESELGERAGKLAKGNVSQSQLADALKEVQGSLRGMVERSNPNYAKELKNINKGYANFKVLQKASANNRDDGIFTPAQLQAAVRMSDRTKDRGGFAKGAALMQDLSETAKNTLPNNIPNSGTIDRGLMFGLGSAALGGASYGAGEMTGNDLLKYGALLAAPSLLYTRPAQAVNSAIYKHGSKAASKLAPIAPYVGAPLISPLAN